ncbi:MAG: hypothetical protein JNM63_13145, partial [Spirochaetia bacterium]|nr:hypothetical protein [Spirochaetia bacterium]
GLSAGAAFAQIQGIPFTSMMGKDFHPSAVSRGGAIGTYIDEPTSIYYNPAIGPFLEKSIKSTISLSHALLPAQVWLDYVGIFFKPKPSYHVYLSAIYFASDTELINARNDKFGEMNSQTFLFTFNLGYLIPKTPFSWGFTGKILTGRSFIYDRTMFGLDGGMMAVFPKANLKTFLSVKNLGIDAIDIAKILNNAGPVEQRSLDISNAFSAQWPLSVSAGVQYEFLKLFQFFFDLDFFPGKITDAYFLPHAGVSFVGLPDFKFNVGWVFRDEAGANFPSFGIEWNIRLSGLPVIGLQYAFEPIPGLADNHYFGMTFRFQ